jgi:branched-chain amino acid transport system ATP-binding protein
MIRGCRTPISARSHEMNQAARSLKVEGLVTGYRQMEILHGVSIEAHSGEIVVVIGPNGSGKSTMLRAICGLLRTWGGSIHLGDTDLTRLSPRQRLVAGVGYVPQSRNTFTSMTVTDNLRIGALRFPEGASERLTDVFAIFPVLAELRAQIVGKLSGGQQQMVAIGRALMAGPSVLLLDEPTAGLAPKVVDELFNTIRRITRRGVSTVIVEQNAITALNRADRAYVLASGENRMQGRARQVLEDPAVRKLYLGESDVPRMPEIAEPSP